MFRLLQILALGALVTLSACNSPGMGYRSSETDPDVRLIGLMSVLHGEDVTQSCPNGCAERGKPNCERCRHLIDERGRIVIDHERTRNQIERLALEYPNHAPTLFAAASLAYEAGEKERAAGYLDELLSRHPVHPEAAVLRSRIAIEEGNLSGARRTLEQQIQFTPDHAGLREALSATQFLDGDLMAALTQLEVAERLGAPAWRVAFNRGLIAETAGNARGAIEQYEISLAERPEYRAAASRKAGLLATAGEAAF
ncbi:MAG: tetratricopeptide repeat protein [Planctomycetes bacterium]|nr:tetratricopeptide repeat protein [Planctomycetota bacterium]MCB9904822.1 tetratricopeptide repeat protein [Planctomycetota bacterium]